MEPITHVLTGACLSRSGLNRRTAYATAAMAIAAEFPDVDTLWQFRGPVSGFQHHRGITHTFVGLPFEAAFILLAFAMFHRLRVQRNRRKLTGPTGTVAGAPGMAETNWATLYALILLALLSHLVLDYTNNYGLRPFFPFDDRWFAGSIVFIFDPVIFLLLVAGLVLPALFGLIGREVGAPRERYRGRSWATAALLGVVLLWAVRGVEHSKALRIAQTQTVRAPAAIDASLSGQTSAPAMGVSAAPEASSEPAPAPFRPLLQPRRSLANPDPLSIFRWYTVTDYGPVYKLGVADTSIGTWTSGRQLSKISLTPTVRAADSSPLGRAYLDWSPMPVLRVSTGAPDGLSGQTGWGAEQDSTVVYSDPRFMGDIPLLSRGDQPPLTGEVVVGPGGRVVAEALDGHFGR